MVDANQASNFCIIVLHEHWEGCIEIANPKGEIFHPNLWTIVYLVKYIEILLHKHCSGCIEIAKSLGGNCSSLGASPLGMKNFPLGICNFNASLPMFVQYYIAVHFFHEICFQGTVNLSVLQWRNVVTLTATVWKLFFSTKFFCGINYFINELQFVNFTKYFSSEIRVNSVFPQCEYTKKWCMRERASLQ